ncbi:hypothetical protein SLOPH_500, partial [Spraguea lophii 42_110]
MYQNIYILFFILKIRNIPMLFFLYVIHIFSITFLIETYNRVYFVDLESMEKYSIDLLHLYHNQTKELEAKDPEQDKIVLNNNLSNMIHISKSKNNLDYFKCNVLKGYSNSKKENVVKKLRMVDGLTNTEERVDLDN